MVAREESPIEGLAFFPNPENRVFYPGAQLPFGTRVEVGVQLPPGYQFIDLADRFSSKAHAAEHYAGFAMRDLPGAVIDLFQYGVNLVRYGPDVPYVVVNMPPVGR